MWIKLTPNECVDRALQAPSKSHERQWWFDLAQLMIDAQPQPRIESQPRPFVSHYDYAVMARDDRKERLYRRGTSY